MTSGAFTGGYGNAGSYHSAVPQYSLTGVSVPSFSSSGPEVPYGLHHPGSYYRDERPSSLYSHNNHQGFSGTYGRDNSASTSSTIAFRDDNNAAESAQQLAYSGYSEYRSKNKSQ